MDVGIGDEGIEVGLSNSAIAVMLGDGDTDRRADGKMGGDFEGDVEGEVDGDFDGALEGEIDGDFEGEVDGNFEGADEGEVEGARKVSKTRAYPV